MYFRGIMKKESISSNNITHGIIWKQMILFFLPLLLGSFFQQLYNTVDAIIVGRVVGKAALAAVGGSSAMIVGLFVGFFTGISTGASVTIAQCYGAEDAERTERAVHTAFAMAVAGGVILTVVCIITAPYAIALLNTPEEIRPDSVLYLRIFFCGMVPNLVYNMGAGILRAVGDSRSPLYVLMAGCVLNIVLDLSFVLFLGMGVAGAAVATIISQTISAFLVMYILMRSTDSYRLVPRRIRLDLSMLRHMLRIGLPTGLESVMYMISNLMIQAAINGFGTDAVSAWAAYGKLDTAFWMIIQSLGIAVTTFVGQNFGAGKYSRIRTSIKSGFVMSLIFTAVLTVLLMVFGETLYYMFTSDKNVVSIGTDMLRYLVRFYAAFICIEMFSGALRGMGETLKPMLITFFGTCLLRIIWLLLAVPRWHTIYTVEASYPITWIITSVIILIYFMKYSGPILKRADH